MKNYSKGTVQMNQIKFVKNLKKKVIETWITVIYIHVHIIYNVCIKLWNNVLMYL